MKNQNPEFEIDAQTDAALSTVVYYMPADKYVYSINGEWQITSPVGKEGIKAHLSTFEIPPDKIEAIFTERMIQVVHGTVMAAGQTEHLVSLNGLTYINCWVPPTLTPAPGEFPIFELVLDHLTNHDAEGVRWVKNWLAYKIQNPMVVPKIAIVFATEQGAGKGVLCRFIREALGMRNTAEVTRGALESRFNSRWIDKLFVFADEVMTSENAKDITDRLKVYIDGTDLELEGKGTNQRSVQSRLAWVFASNDKITPVMLETGDRRYTVFANHDTPHHKPLLDALWVPNARSVPLPSFLAEMQAFLYYLQNLEIDMAFIRKPYDNQARRDLIAASTPMYAAFVDEIREVGIDPLLEEVVSRGDYTLGKSRPEWDFDERGVSREVVRLAYERFCQMKGGKPLGDRRFGVAMKHLGIESSSPVSKTTGRQVRCYVVPRQPAPKRKEDDPPKVNAGDVFPNGTDKGEA